MSFDPESVAKDQAVTIAFRTAKERQELRERIATLERELTSSHARELQLRGVLERIKARVALVSPHYEHVQEALSLPPPPVAPIAERDQLRVDLESAKRDANEWFGKWERNETEKINLRAELERTKPHP